MALIPGPMQYFAEPSRKIDLLFYLVTGTSDERFAIGRCMGLRYIQNRPVDTGGTRPKGTQDAPYKCRIIKG